MFSNYQLQRGNFRNGELSGKGIKMTFNNTQLTDLNQKIEGDFLNGLAHGRCRIERIFGNGPPNPNMVKGRDFRAYIQIYEGDCVNDNREGFGTMIFKYQDKADKTIVNKIHSLNQRKYEGEFSDNMPNGYGTMVYENGARYVGYFVDGQR